MPKTKKKGTSLVPVAPKAKTQLVTADVEKVQDAKDSKEAYAQMNEKLQAASQKVMSMLLNIAQEGIKRMWKLGEFVYKIKSNEDIYGEDAMYLLGKVLGSYHRSTIQKAVALNNWITEVQLEKMMAMKMKISGKPLSWQHYEKLLTIKDEDQRKAALKSTIENEWTPEELQKAAQAARGTTAAHAGGRPVAVPATFTARSIRFIKQLDAITRDAESIYDNEQFGFYETAESMPADKITPEMVEKTNEMVERVRGMLDFSRQFVLRLEDVSSILQQRMDEQAQQEGAKEAAEITINSKKSSQVVETE